MAATQLALALSCFCAAAAAAAPLPPPPVLPPFALEGTVDFALQLAASVPLARPTNRKRADYLPTIAGVVQYMRTVQNATGHIVDPFRNLETQYATPCFAFACATAWSEGLDATLLPNCTSALTAATEELALDTCADGHCVFFMKPVMFAYRLFKASGAVDPSIIAQWDANLEKMNPWKDFGFPSNNWGLVGAAGDLLRTQLITQFGNTSWSDAMMASQFTPPDVYTQITANGLYQDHSGTGGLNPLPYDTFPTSGYLTMLLREGYNGTFAPFLRELTRRAALSHLVMQSPFGEIPTGGRSSQHQWNEAVSAMAWEIAASEAKERGDDAQACVFKRAAHLAAESVARWQRVDGPYKGSLSIIKNWFSPDQRWGYEGYSFLTNYNNLPAAMLSAAFMYADDSIPECSAPADVGGFVFELPEHHLVIANAAGVYAEIETGPDCNYEPLGLHRVHMDTCGVGAAGSCVRLNPLLVTSAGPPCGAVGEGGSGGPIAIGPWWSTSRDAPGAPRTPMSGFSYANVSAVQLTPGFSISANKVEFDLTVALGASGVVVQQHYALSAAADGSAPAIVVTSSASLAGAPQPGLSLTRFGLQLPAFLFEGRTNVSLALDAAANTATVSAPGWGVATLSVAPDGRNITWAAGEEAPHHTRNGLMSQVWVETDFSTLAPSLVLTIAGANNAAPAAEERK